MKGRKSLRGAVFCKVNVCERMYIVCSSSGDFWPGVDSIRSPQKLLLLSNSSFAAELLKLIQYRNSSQLLKNYAIFFISIYSLYFLMKSIFHSEMKETQIMSVQILSLIMHITPLKEEFFV